MFAHLLWDGGLTLAGKRGYSHSDSFSLLNSLLSRRDSIWPVARKSIATRSLLQTAQQFARRSRRALLGSADKEYEYVARLQFGMSFLDARKAGWFAAMRPRMCVRGPSGERLRRITGFDRCGAAHEPRINEIRSQIRERRVVGRIGEYRRCAVLARERQEFGR